MLSRCPVISMPSGRRADNVPTGIQLVGAADEDVVVMQAAKAYESAFGQWYLDPGNRPEIKNNI